MSISPNIKLQQIGKGSFSTVYKLNSNKVLIKSNDYTKECMAHGWGFDSSLFPKVSFEDNDFYSMKLYPKCKAPKKELNKRSYERYTLLRKLMNETFTHNKYDKYDKLYKLFSDIKDKTLKEALLNAIDGLSNYGSDIGFEISPRNISFTKSGNLILLDCFFFISQLEETRK